MDELDRALINTLQGGLALSERPYAEVAGRLGTDEAQVIERLRRLLDRGVLSRFGPMYDAQRLGGALSLCAMQVPAERFDQVAAQVNRLPQVAHNYAREHRLNMWFVVATETPDEVEAVLRRIEEETGLPVYSMPREREFFVGLRLEA
jgi:DNA-binding Lrp family transcriptional regulator